MSSEQQLISTKTNGDAGTSFRRVCSWRLLCKKKSRRKSLTSTSPIDSASSSHPQNAIHIGAVQHYGQPPAYPDGHGRQWGSENGLLHGQLSFPLPTQCYMNAGQTRILNGQVTTTFRGVETVIPTHEYLSLTPGKREMIGHAGFYPNSNGFKPIAPPPDAHTAPPPPPPPPPAPESTSPPAQMEKKCANGDCGKTTGLAMIHGVDICHNCIERNNYLVARLALVRGGGTGVKE